MKTINTVWTVMQKVIDSIQITTLTMFDSNAQNNKHKLHSQMVYTDIDPIRSHITTLRHSVDVFAWPSDFDRTAQLKSIRLQLAFAILVDWIFVSCRAYGHGMWIFYVELRAILFSIHTQHQRLCDLIHSRYCAHTVCIDYCAKECTHMPPIYLFTFSVALIRWQN